MGTYANGTDRPTFTLEPVHAQRMRELVADEHPLGSQLEWLLDCFNSAATLDDPRDFDSWAAMAVDFDIAIDKARERVEPMPAEVRVAALLIGQQADYAAGLIRAGLLK